MPKMRQLSYILPQTMRTIVRLAGHPCVELTAGIHSSMLELNLIYTRAQAAAEDTQWHCQHDHGRGD
jgi:hypothetical protein